MSGLNDYQTQAVSANINEYSENYHGLKWLSPVEAETAEKTRESLLSALGSDVAYGFKKTKLDCRNLSPSCRFCGGGEWFCLFINGKCNCRCFYFPTHKH
jgi:hypothetical protein